VRTTSFRVENQQLEGLIVDNPLIGSYGTRHALRKRLPPT
jgi:hypothetical protein